MKAFGRRTSDAYTGRVCKLPMSVLRTQPKWDLVVQFSTYERVTRPSCAGRRSERANIGLRKQLPQVSEYSKANYGWTCQLWQRHEHKRMHAHASQSSCHACAPRSDCGHAYGR